MNGESDVNIFSQNDLHKRIDEKYLLEIFQTSKNILLTLIIMK